jgi:endogenous inhibitor of DNA gyrase (YacG/DUF329 family)
MITINCLQCGTSIPSDDPAAPFCTEDCWDGWIDLNAEALGGLPDDGECP